MPDNILIFYTPLLKGKHFCNMTHLPFVLFPNMVDQVSLSCSCHLNAALCRVPVKLASDTRVSSVKRPRQPLLTVHLSPLRGVFQDLKEECVKLRTRVFDLEQQNRILSVLFQQRVKMSTIPVSQVGAHGAVDPNTHRQTHTASRLFEFYMSGASTSKGYLL